MLEIFATVVGIATAIVGTFLTTSNIYRSRVNEMMREYADREKKQYAAERDFQHLQRNYQNLQVSVDQLFKEVELRVERVETRINRINIMVRAIAVKLSSGDVVKDLLDSQQDDE